MSGTSLMVDTNIVLYLLAGDETLAEMLNGKDIHVSFITEMELLGYKQITAVEEKKVQAFLADAQVADFTQAIKQKAIAIRRATGMKLPDSIIGATAALMNIPLLTADGGFSKIKDLDHLHYLK